MLFWHVGATTAITRYTFRDERMDLRLLFVGAILPDLIDTPIGLIWYSALGSARLVAHSLLFAGLLMTWVVLATRRGRPRKRWMPLAIGVLIHLFLDAMWADPETLWWPILGVDFSQNAAMTSAEYVSSVVRNWWVWLGELLGLVYMGALARAGGLDNLAALRQFRESGRINAPIGRSAG